MSQQFQPPAPRGEDTQPMPVVEAPVQQPPTIPVTPQPTYAQPQFYQKQPMVHRTDTKSFLIILGIIVLFLGVCGYALASQSRPSASDTVSSQSTQEALDLATANAYNTQDAQSAAPPDSPTPTTQPTTIVAQPTTVPIPTQPSAPTFLTFQDGTYRVGADIQPGTYRTRSASPSCYYARLKGFGGTGDDILANNFTDFPAIVTILPSDAGFTSQNCGAWTTDLSQITDSTTSFGDGMYFVHTDIAPGTYRDTGGTDCYYARLSGFSSSDDIIVNGFTSAPAIITIAASDKGFEAHGCGTWTKI